MGIWRKFSVPFWCHQLTTKICINLIAKINHMNNKCLVAASSNCRIHRRPSCFLVYYLANWLSVFIWYKRSDSSYVNCELCHFRVLFWPPNKIFRTKIDKKKYNEQNWTVFTTLWTITAMSWLCHQRKFFVFNTIIIDVKTKNRFIEIKCIVYAH